MQENLKLAWPNTLNCKKKEVNKFPYPKNIAVIKDIIKRSNELKDQVIVLKIPSEIINHEELFTSFAEAIQLIEMCGAKIYIIHEHIDLKKSSLSSIFSKNLIKEINKMELSSSIMVEILSNYINKLIVTKLSSVGCYAIGLSGKDANLIQARKSKLSHRRTENQDVIDIGFISEPIIINPEILLNFEDHNIIPVISPVANDDQAYTHLLNADTTAAAISSALGADHLILTYEAPKTFELEIKLQDIDTLKLMLADNNNFVKRELIDIAISALENNTGCVHFINSKIPNSVLFTVLGTSYK